MDSEGALRIHPYMVLPFPTHPIFTPSWWDLYPTTQTLFLKEIQLLRIY